MVRFPIGPGRRHLLVLIAGIGVLPGSVLGQQQRPLEIDDLFRLKSVGNPQMSPNGTWVAYTVTTTSLEENKRESRVWMVATAGGDPIPMTAVGSSASNPRWSPDGRYLSFTAARNEGKSQVWLLDRRGGEARQLTNIKQGVSGYVWSPDGDRILLSIRDPEEDEPEADATKKKDAPKDPWVIDRLQFKRDGTGYLMGDRHTHLYVFDMETEDVQQVTSGRWDETQPAWSPDGTRIAFVSNRTEDPDANSNSDIWIVAAGNTDQGQTLLRVTTFEGADIQPAWSPHGETLAYVTGTHEPRFDAYATRRLAVVPSVGGERRILLEAMDRSVSNPEFTEDGEAIRVSVQDSGEQYLAQAYIKGDKFWRILNGEARMGAFSSGPWEAVAAVVTTHNQPGEIFIIGGDERKQLTHVNDSLISALTLAEVQNFTVPSTDGAVVEGWIFTPPGYDSALRYPTLLRIHGGPNGMYGVGWNFEAQMFAANGYVVVLTNPRGSSGYGMDFGMALWQRWGTPDFDDVMAGVDYAIAEGYSDPSRLGVGGWSYGGILTNYVVTKTNRFKAATTGASMALLAANFGHDQYQLSNEREWGLPWESRELWEGLSPFNDIDKVETPTLILGGEQDWNVPIQNSEQLYQALRRLGVDTQLVVYPGQPHGLRVPSYQKDRLERYLAWYARYVKAAEHPITEEDKG